MICSISCVFFIASEISWLLVNSKILLNPVLAKHSQWNFYSRALIFWNFRQCRCKLIACSWISSLSQFWPYMDSTNVTSWKFFYFFLHTTSNIGKKNSLLLRDWAEYDEWSSFQSTTTCLQYDLPAIMVAVSVISFLFVNCF